MNSYASELNPDSDLEWHPKKKKNESQTGFNESG
jgi:hypothetical protein